MRLTDPYWTPDPQFEPRVFQNTKIAGVKQDDNGIRYNAPPSLPEGVNWYQGSNEYALNLPKKIVYTWQEEFYAHGNQIPSAAGWPLVNPYSKHVNFKRSDHTVMKSYI